MCKEPHHHPSLPFLPPTHSNLFLSPFPLYFSYLTPAGTQGFAPHSDDIEAFVLQLEGKKHWKLYRPRHYTLYIYTWKIYTFNFVYTFIFAGKAVKFCQESLVVSSTTMYVMYRERVWSTARTMYIISWNCILTGNLSQDDLGEPIMDVILEPGDLLYFPRGTFHQVYVLYTLSWSAYVCTCM